MASIEMIRRYLDHITAKEFDEAMGYWADDIVVHVSGNNVCSGTHTGKEVAAEYSATAVSSVDSFQIEEHDLLVNDQHAVVLRTTHNERNGEHMSSNAVVIYHTEGDQITELWVIPEDQSGLDDFLA